MPRVSFTFKSIFKMFRSRTPKLKHAHKSFPMSPSGTNAIGFADKQLSITCQSTNEGPGSGLGANEARFSSLTETPLSTYSETDGTGTLSEYSRSQDVQAVEYKAKLTGALIASSDALSDDNNRMIPQSDPSIPLLQQVASCLPASRSTSDLEISKLESFVGPLSSLKRSRNSSNLKSMVCTVQYYDDDILQPYHGTCHEILLESMHPDTPRIVVTPPEEGTNIAWANAIGPQYYSYLTVIPFYYSTCWLPSLEEYAQMFYAAHLQTPGQDSNSLNNSDAFSESSLLETPSEMGLIKSNYSMSLEDELQELNISLPYQSLDQAAANVFLVKAPSEGASKFFIDNHGSWDTDSLPDMETDPFFVEVCAQLAGSAKTVMGTP